jgi:hypothetical protein
VRSDQGCTKPYRYPRVGVVEFGVRGKNRGHPGKIMTTKSKARNEGPKLWKLFTGLARTFCQIASYFSGGGCRHLGSVDA